MKYRLIDKTTGIETLCDKVTIDGFDYYVSDEEIKESDWYLAWETINNIHSNHIVQKATNSEPVGMYSWASNYKKVIATNNPNIDIPKVVDEVEELSLQYGYTIPAQMDEDEIDYAVNGFYNGYNKSQEKHPFSEENMIDFAEFYFREEFNSTMQNCKSSKEILRLWKEQQPKIVYYNE